MSNYVLGGLGNTRPENTREESLRSLIDYVSITFKVHTSDYTEIQQILGLENLEFEHFDWGKDTFKEHIRYSNIVIQRKNDFTYQLHLSGQGCREFETHSSLNWLKLFLILKDFCHAKATRIDIAIDDFKGYYDVSMIRNTFLDGRCVTRMRYADDRKRYNTSDQAVVLDTFYLGSINARLSINFYDKKLERESSGYDVLVDQWTRTELRCKREYADDIIDLLLFYDGDIGKIILGVLKDKVRFIRKSKEKNKSRVSSLQWWDRFLKDVEVVKLSLQAPDQTIEKTKNWFNKSVAPAFAMLKEADSKEFDIFVSEMLSQGKERLKGKHYDMIKQYKDLTNQRAFEVLKGYADSLKNDDEKLSKGLERIKKDTLRVPYN